MVGMSGSGRRAHWRRMCIALSGAIGFLGSAMDPSAFAAAKAVHSGAHIAKALGKVADQIPQANDPYFIAGQTRSDGLAQALSRKDKRAKNIILFIGDGMGVATVTAGRIFVGQSQGKDGESYELNLDQFPHTALSRTYSHDFQVADSAATATAMTTGAKTRSGILGLRASAELGKCASAQGALSRTLWEQAEGRGMATGVVTTTRITHATPASTYAHIPHRDWENDAIVQRMNGGDCVDIARQLVEWPYGDGLEVAFGGGRANFLPSEVTDPEYPNQKGARADHLDLTQKWLAGNHQRVYVWNQAQFDSIDPKLNQKVLGLFSPSHMAYSGDRPKDQAGEPSLAQMTAKAIAILQQNPQGFILMVEGGRIDHAHHEGKAGRALRELADFDEAIGVALQMTDRADTLIVATADHSHTLTISGYAPRNRPILGLSGAEEGPANGKDGLPYTTLGYANGPGAVIGGKDGAIKRPDLTGQDLEDPDFRQQSLVPLDSETHGGEDVGLYAWGPGDKLFAGTLEENVIYHNMLRALGWK